MEDAQLANYLPSYGDRIALFSFCKRHTHSSKRKQGLFEKLREKLKLRKENHSREEVPETSNKTRNRTKRSTRNIEIGWVHTDNEVTKQVRAKQGRSQLTFKNVFMFCLAVCSSNKRLSLFFFLLGLDTVTSVISCCLPKPAHTQPSVCLDIRDRVLGMFACKYVVSRVCASVLGRVHSLSTDTLLSFRPDAPCVMDSGPVVNS